ncbi:MFS transporter [Sphingomonas pokkalii]|nr:MFS transporter [Sphingomonas pokkalii]
MASVTTAIDRCGAMPRNRWSPARVRHRFGAAHFAKSMVWSFSDLLLAWFLHAVLHIPVERVALLLFVLLLVGAVCNAAAGALITWSRMSRRALVRLHFLASIATTIALLAQFADNGGVGTALAAGILFRIAYALYDVPQTAMTSLLPRDSGDAHRYVALRTTLGAVARLIVTAANLAIAQLPAALFTTGALPLLLGFGVLVVATAWILRDADAGAPPAASCEAPARASLRPPQGTLPILTAFFLSTLGFATLSRLLLFYPPAPGLTALGAWLLLLFSVGTVLGPSLALHWIRRCGWNRACIASAALGMACALPLLTLPGLPGPLLGGAFGYGLGLGAAGALLWQAATDVVRVHAERCGERADALVFGLVIFTIHIAIAIALGALPLAVLVPALSSGAGIVWPGLAITWGSGAAVVALLLYRRAAPASAPA